MEHLIKQLISGLGEDPDREGLQKTPHRVIDALQELTSGYQSDITNIINEALYKNEGSEMVLIKEIEFCSTCEHHLLPFFGKAHIAYVPHEKIIGLSKIPRIVDVFAKRLQIQERLTTQIAEAIEHHLRPKGVAVMIEATHSCMMIRGVKKQQAETVTTRMTGVFSEDSIYRRDFWASVK